MMQRFCSKCKKYKALSEFGKDKFRKGGLKCWCKECRKEEYLENREEILKKHKEYYTRPENKLKKAKQDKEYRDKPENKIKISKQRKEHYLENREEILKQFEEYRNRPENKARQKKYQKEYRCKNKEKTNKRSDNRRKTDVGFRLSGNLRTRVRQALRRNSKSLSTMFLIGCSIDYLMYHLQSQFTKGMSWDNYGLGGWEIDHIKPCAKFDLTKNSEQLICFNYTNIQPLWAEDNRKKGNK